MSIRINRSRNTLPTRTLLAILLPCLGCRAAGLEAFPFWPPARTTPPAEQSPLSQNSQLSNKSVGIVAAEATQAEPVDFQIDQLQNSELARAQANTEAAIPTDLANLPSVACEIPDEGLTDSVQVPQNAAKRNSHQRDTYSQTSTASNLVSAKAASLPSEGTTAPQATIPLRITGVRTNLGPVRLAVFTNPDTFPTPSSAAWTNVTPSTNSTVTVACPQTGRMAVAAYQDLNNDGELNRNRFGIPLEPFAFSNGATGDRGPPTFSAAAVDAAASQTPIHLALP